MIWLGDLLTGSRRIRRALRDHPVRASLGVAAVDAAGIALIGVLLGWDEQRLAIAIAFVLVVSCAVGSLTAIAERRW